MGWILFPLSWAQLEAQKELQRQQSPENTLRDFRFLEEQRRLRELRDKDSRLKARKKQQKKTTVNGHWPSLSG